MRLPLRSALTPYATAIFAVAVAILGTLLVRPVIKPITTPLFLAAIVFTAWRCGKWPGLVTTLLSGLAIDYVFISPRYHLSGHWDNIGRISLFMIEGAILCWLIDSRLQAANEVRQSREELRALYGDLQSLIEHERARIAREFFRRFRELSQGAFRVTEPFRSGRRSFALQANLLQ